MFFRLRHYTFIRRDNQKRGVNAAYARQHVRDEIAVTGHVYYADFFAVGEREEAEAEFDGHLADLFFLETVGMSAGKRGDQSGFSVVNVTGGSDNSHKKYFSLSSFLGDERRKRKATVEELGLNLLLAFLGRFVMTHDAFVSGEPLMRYVHKLLQLLFGRISGLVHLVLQSLRRLI